ncbi:LOW QUALITY PROTEIN: hypothetical protein OSB04_006986 [Centaurea solstitialis]|uniref:Reverse transcriptase Ty1/copia-type domain-containing protein n=1 Tax=Centaurea solstitialis TaxID=347529 RepID=A0AA38TWU6_9ASTR|nr:LOW QUALITY PROTEIN: hypothetical protein OSB04_006986 [Centaurea solstitialis]
MILEMYMKLRSVGIDDLPNSNVKTSVEHTRGSEIHLVKNLKNDFPEPLRIYQRIDKPSDYTSNVARHLRVTPVRTYKSNKLNETRKWELSSFSSTRGTFVGRSPVDKISSNPGCKCYVLNDREPVGKFDPKGDNAIFIGCAWDSVAYRVYVPKTQIVVVSTNVIQNKFTKELNIQAEASPNATIIEDLEKLFNEWYEDFEDTDRASANADRASDAQPIKNKQKSSMEIPMNLKLWKKLLPTFICLMLGPKITLRLKSLENSQRVSRPGPMSIIVSLHAFKTEPKKVTEALADPFWVEAMQDELLQFERNNVWTLTLLSNGKAAIGTKWVFRNKKDENGVVIRNKARLVAQGYCQEEGIDYEETFCPFCKARSHQNLFGLWCLQRFQGLQDGFYVKQPPNFESEKYPNHVYFLHKALYSLKQAPRAWYEFLSTFLTSHQFHIGTTDITLFYKKLNDDILLVQVYVDDIIFGSTNTSMCKEFESLM